MIIVPEIATVFITPPRTASTAIRAALLARFPQAFAPYRHMEADGVPHGYDRYLRVGFCRHPVDRLLSLYAYLSDPKSSMNHKGTPAWQEKARAAGAKSFSDWLRDPWVFTNPYDSAGSLFYHPKYAVLHSLPEQAKSQFVYLRPDLGTEILPFANVTEIMAARFDCTIGFCNESSGVDASTMTTDDLAFIAHRHEWDLTACRGGING